MKKFLLLLAAGAVGFSANAQQLQTKSPVFTGASRAARVPVEKTAQLHKRAVSHIPGQKTTAAPRWYSYATDMGTIEPNLGGFAIPTWFDSTIVQTFISGDGPINYSAEALVYDLSRFALYHDPTLHGGEMIVKATDTITIDSVSFSAVYQQNTSRPANIVDTLYISVAPSTGRYILNKNDPDFTWANAYIPNKDTLYGYSPYNVDSVNRAAFSDIAGINRVFWKMPLDPARRDTSFDTKTFTFAVPNGGLRMVGGNMFSVTVAFKSGDTWVTNTTNVNDRHHWMLVTAANLNGTSGARMPYHYYDLNDRNMSNLMFSTDTTRFLPSVIIEGINTIDFRYEFHNIDVHVACPTCLPLSINDVGTLASVGEVYPNPATDNATIAFSVKDAADVNVTLSNSVGQVVKTQSLGKFNANQHGGARIDISNLSNGLYFVTVNANGQHVTKRLVVTH